MVMWESQKKIQQIVEFFCGNICIFEKFLLLLCPKTKKAMKLLYIILSIRYVFYMIGDGMGANQVLAAEMYQAELQGQIGRVPLCMSTFPYSGQAATFSLSNGITDSSAAGTCLASGQKTDNGHLGTTPDNQPIISIATLLKEQGWGVGIMTTVAIDHATPGAFYAHVPNRDEYYTIGTQLAESKFDFFGGAGFHRPDNDKVWKAPNLYELCEQSGYMIARGAKEAMDVAESAERMILVQENDGRDIHAKSESLPYAIDRREGDLSLREITETAISFLDKRYDHFFMMVEGGKIDYAGHANDGATNIRETIDFDDAIRTVYEFYLKHPDETLIVVTADHETGGMALGCKNYTLNLQALRNQTASSWLIESGIKQMHDRYGKKLKWDQVKTFLTNTLGLYGQVEVSEKENAALKAAYQKLIKNKGTNKKTLYQDISELGGCAVSILNHKSMLGWTTYAHTASAVPIFAIGKGAEVFTGWHDNSEIAPLILECVR